MESTVAAYPGWHAAIQIRFGAIGVAARHPSGLGERGGRRRRVSHFSLVRAICQAAVADGLMVA